MSTLAVERLGLKIRLFICVLSSCSLASLSVASVARQNTLGAQNIDGILVATRVSQRSDVWKIIEVTFAGSTLSFDPEPISVPDGSIIANRLVVGITIVVPIANLERLPRIFPYFPAAE